MTSAQVKQPEMFEVDGLKVKILDIRNPELKTPEARKGAFMFLMAVDRKHDATFNPEKPGELLTYSKIIADLTGEKTGESTYHELEKKIFSSCTRIEKLEFAFLEELLKHGTYDPASRAYQRPRLKEAFENYTEFKKLALAAKNNFSKLPVSTMEAPANPESLLPGHLPEKSPLPEMYIRANGAKIKKIVESTSSIKPGELLPAILPKEAKASSADEIGRFIEVFGKYLYSRGNNCRDATTNMQMLAQNLGIDLYIGSGNGHAYGVVKVKDPKGGGANEYRIDATANQFTEEYIGIAVTPRIKDMGENFSNPKEDELYGFTRSPYGRVTSRKHAEDQREDDSKELPTHVKEEIREDPGEPALKSLIQILRKVNGPEAGSSKKTSATYAKTSDIVMGLMS